MSTLLIHINSYWDGISMLFSGGYRSDNSEVEKLREEIYSSVITTIPKNKSDKNRRKEDLINVMQDMNKVLKSYPAYGQEKK